MKFTTFWPVAMVAVSYYSLIGQNAVPAYPTYFPPKVFADLKHGRYLDGKLQETWFSFQLFDLHEPSLIGRSPNDLPVYRFTLLPSFCHPVVIRVNEHADGTATVITRVGKGAGGYAPKGLLIERSTEINTNKVAAMKAAIQSSAFWHLPTELNHQSGTDGTEWVFEASDAGRYHVVDRWEGADLRTLGLFFLQQLGHPDPEAQLSSRSR